jgi:hypothetical protein
VNEQSMGLECLVYICRSSLTRTTVSYEMPEFFAVEAWSFGFLWGLVWKACQHSICGGLVGSRKASIVWCSYSGQVHRDLYVVVTRS